MHLLLKLDSILSIFAELVNCKNSEFKVLESFPVRRVRTFYCFLNENSHRLLYNVLN